MKLSEFKNNLEQVENFTIQLPNGTLVPAHFHITEMGLLTKNFIDCGNTIHEEKAITFQVWFAGDLEHRLAPSKVFKIIEASKKLIGDNDFELEVILSTVSHSGVYDPYWPEASSDAWSTGRRSCQKVCNFWWRRRKIKIKS